MGVVGQYHTPTTLLLGKRPGTHCIGGWVGLMAGLEGCGNLAPPPGFNPWTIQHVVSRYTD